MNPKETGIGASFEEQFLNVEYLQFGNERIPSIDISPEKPTGRPVLFVPGWNAKIDDYMAAIEELFRRGKRVLSAEFSGTEDEKAEEIQDLVTGRNIIGADIIAHSVGSISTALAALKRPDIFHKMVFLNPASMVGEDSEKGLIRRYAQLLKEESNESVEQGEGGVRRFFDMARVITKFDMYSSLRRLRELGVSVTSVHALSDRLFPHERIELEASRQDWKNIIIRPGGHLSIDGLIPDALELLKN